MVKTEFVSCGMETPHEDIKALRRLAKESGGVNFLEVGSWAGRTALAMAGAVKGSKVFCVDTWQGSPKDRSWQLAMEHDVFAAFCCNAGPRLFKSIIPCRGRSLDWAKVWPAHLPLDLCFIDASHEYGDVAADIRAWTPHIRSGGILCGHDFGVFDGVNVAVNEVGGCKLAGKCLWWKRV